MDKLNYYEKKLPINVEQFGPWYPGQFVLPGRANFLIDGQFGSTGKGLMAAYMDKHDKIDIAVSNASANAGHTAIISGEDGFNKTIVCNHLPISGVLNRSNLIYLCAGSVIDPKILWEEITKYNVDLNRIKIHPRAAVIIEQDCFKELEPSSMTTALASTRHGVGQALARKITREALLAKDCNLLKPLIGELNLNEWMRQGNSVFMEIPQGFSLGINSGLSYPYCTSREISIAQAMSDAQIHPSFLGNVMMTMRTYPIRVGNIYKDGKQIGWSGPWYPDQTELEWNMIGVEPEITTVTKRVRRVASFSMLQYGLAMDAIKPTHVFLNFVNYLTEEKFISLVSNFLKVPSHFGIGPHVDDVYTVDELTNMFLHLKRGPWK